MNGKFLLQGANIKTGKVLVLSCTNTLSNFLLNRDESANLSDLELKMVAERKAGRDNRGGRDSKE